MGFLPILLPFLEAVTGKRINPGGPKRPFQKTDEFGGQRPKKKRINVRQSGISQDGLHAYIPGSFNHPARAIHVEKSPRRLRLWPFALETNRHVEHQSCSLLPKLR